MKKVVIICAVLCVGAVVFGAVIANNSSSSSNSNQAVTSGQTAQVGSKAPAFSFKPLNSNKDSLSDFSGKRMVWVYATWCSTCKEAARVLSQKNEKLADAGLQVIALKAYNNVGYPGPSINQFFSSFPKLKSADNWTFGTVSKDMSSKYNPRRRPDVYYLIDEFGTVQAKTGAPAATINRILQFAKN